MEQSRTRGSTVFDSLGLVNEQVEETVSDGEDATYSSFKDRNSSAVGENGLDDPSKLDSPQVAVRRTSQAQMQPIDAIKILPHVPEPIDAPVITVGNLTTEESLVSFAKSTPKQLLPTITRLRLFLTTKCFPFQPLPPDIFFAPKETYVPVSARVLAAEVIGDCTRSLGAETGASFQRFLMSLKSYYQLMYIDRLSEVLDCFTYFDPVNGAERIRADSVLGLELDKVEDAFLDNLGKMLAKGNYTPMTESEMQAARKSNFMLMVKVDLAESELDGRPFQRYVDQNEMTTCADLADTLLIFHRGVGVARLTDYFWKMKLEVMLKRIVDGFGTIGNIVRRRPPPQKEEAKSRTNSVHSQCTESQIPSQSNSEKTIKFSQSDSHLPLDPSSIIDLTASSRISRSQTTTSVLGDGLRGELRTEDNFPLGVVEESQNVEQSALDDVSIPGKTDEKEAVCALDDLIIQDDRQPSLTPENNLDTTKASLTSASVHAALSSPSVVPNSNETASSLRTENQEMGGRWAASTTSGLEDDVRGPLAIGFSWLIGKLDLEVPSSFHDQMIAVLVGSIFLLWAFLEYSVLPDKDNFMVQYFTKLILDIPIACAIGYVFMSKSSTLQSVDPEKILRQKRRQVLRSKSRKTANKGDVKNGKRIERVRLERLPITPGDMFHVNTIQEPTFRDMIIIYRPAGSRMFCLNHYRDIPMADLELIFPRKNIRLNYTTVVYSFLWILIGLMIIASILFMYTDMSQDIGDLAAQIINRGGTPINEDIETYSTRFHSAIFVGLVMVTSAGLFSIRSSYFHHESILSTELSKRGYSKDESLLLQLAHDCAEQEFSEVILAYYVLVMRGPLSATDIQAWVEDFVYTNFDEVFGFEIQDAIDKLLELKIASYSASKGIYTACSINQAIDVIAKKWAKMDLGVKANRSTRLAPGSRNMWQKFLGKKT